MSLFDGFLSTPEMQAVFSESALVQAMLEFEAALAHAEAAAGVIAPKAASAIAGVCKAELYDVTAVVGASRRAGTLAVPLVKKLTETVALFDVESAGVVHWGSTSQDVVDTAMVLLARRALALIDRDVTLLATSLLAFAQQHGDTPMLGRTLMQPAQVLSFGFKLAGWVAPLLRCQQRLRTAADAALQLQLGGAVGTLAVLGERGPEVARHMAQSLQLRLPAAAWHTQRDEWTTLACELGVLTGALGKIARDISLLAQGEVAELSEPSGNGRGTSSTMPHKRNPVASMIALAAALRVPQRVAAVLAAMAQEHERGLGNWQAELAETAGLYLSVHGAVKALADVAGALQVDRERMRRNIDALRGLVFAESVAMLLAQQLGKAAAHALMERLSQQVEQTGRHLRDLTLEALDTEPALRGRFDAERVAALFDPALAARHAVTVAQPQLVALDQQAHTLAQSAPWRVWLPSS